MDQPKYNAIITIANIDDATVAEARRAFQTYREAKVITSGCFDDDVWPASDEVAKHTFNFTIDPTRYSNFGKFIHMELEEYKEYLKTFVICQMGVLSMRTIQEIILETKKIAYFPIDDLENIADELSVEFIYRSSEFFSILPPEGREAPLDEISLKLDNVKEVVRTKSPSNQRTLAPFESFFRFGEIIDRFWQEAADESEKLFYFPIWMWWHISGILPTRPNEFVLIPRDCLIEKDGKFFLTTRKNKIKGSSRTKSYKIQKDYDNFTCEIPASIANEIRWYLDHTKSYRRTDLYTLFIPDTHYRKWGRCRPYTSRYFTYTNLSTCMRYFFKQIVEERYGYTIVYEQNVSVASDEKQIHYLYLGDTRHIAMINLILEGATPSVVMTLAGHNNPEMSAHYYSNISQLIECKTYRQYKKLSKGKQNYTLSKPASHLSVGDFITLGDNSRCYSKRVQKGDYSDCFQSCGPSGEQGYCPNCTYHRDNGMAFQDSNALYTNRIEAECANLDKIVRLVRKGQGDEEDIMAAMLRLRDSEYSYKQYLLETMEAKTNGTKENDN